MAHEAHPQSVRRPRETLGPISNNVSAIPMPPSAMKRSSSIGYLPQAPNTVQQHKRSMSGSRMSLAPGKPSQPVFARSSSGNNIIDVAPSTAQRASSHGFMSTGRKSLMPGATPFSASTPAKSQHAPQETQRRSSAYNSRVSMGPGVPGQHSFFATAPPQTDRPVDPRRLKDPRLREQMGRELIDFLHERKFELEMGHTITAKMMSSPTQKDFNVAFQFLYKCIDPAFRFQKGMEAEIPLLLKQLRYPFEKNITKFQLGAVGGGNWHTFLGLLHWMMQLAKMMEAYATGVYDDACAAAGFDTAADRISLHFLCDSYKTWLESDLEDPEDGENEDPEMVREIIQPHIDVMSAAFDRLNGNNLEQLRELQEEEKDLQAQIDELGKDTPLLEKLSHQIKVAEDDRRKFEDYEAKLETKLERYTSRAKLLDDEIKRVEQELKDAEEDRRTLQLAVDAQGMTIQDIDRMNSERKRLQSGVEIAATRLDECRELVKTQESATSAKMEALEEAVSKYNSLGYLVGIIPSEAPNAHGESYELTLRLGQNASKKANDDRLLADANAGYQPQHLLNLDLRGAVKRSINALKKEIHERLEAAKEQDYDRETLLSRTNEAMEVKKAEVEGLQHRVRAAEQAYEELKENTNAQKMKSDAQIEKMEKELQRLRASLTDSVMLMEQREINANIEYEQLTLKSAALREELHTELERMLQDIIKFKLHIQGSLEAYEEFVAHEVEMECEEQEAAEAEGEEDDEQEADE